MKYNDHPTIQDAWLDEVERFEWSAEDFEIADCAELADELELSRIMADKDDTFVDKMAEWHDYIMDYSLWLPLEQCCYEGVLLPMGQRELRVQTCPTDMLGHLSYFFSRCPAHVKHHLALAYWVMVRADRARRTGNPDWRPESAPPRSPHHDTVFFRPPILKFRNYAR
jgi:hypothetical protein